MTNFKEKNNNSEFNLVIELTFTTNISAKK